MRNIAGFKICLKVRGNRKPVNKPGSVDCSFLLASRLIGFYLLFFIIAGGMILLIIAV